MENTTTLQLIKKIAARTGKTEKAVWRIYTETGFEYIESLQKEIHHARSYKKQFGGMVEQGVDTSITDVFRKIITSHHFWSWWATVVWANLVAKGSLTEDLFIPENILFKILTNDTKNNISRKRAASKPKTAVANTCC